MAAAAAAAEALIADGARVVLSSPHQATASAAAARLAQNAATADSVTWVVADNSVAAPDRLVAAAKDRFGRLDGALVSVGGTPRGTIATTTDEAWRSAFESVLLAPVRLARVLAQRPGTAKARRAAATGAIPGTGRSLVFVLASSVRVPLARLPISNGLFPGLAGVAKTLASELGPAGVRINGVLPVRIATDRVREFDALSGDPDEVRGRESQHIPLRRYGEPEEFARVAAFLAVPGRLVRHGRRDPGRWRRDPVHLSARSSPAPLTQIRPTTPCLAPRARAAARQHYRVDVEQHPDGSIAHTSGAGSASAVAQAAWRRRPRPPRTNPPGVCEGEGQCAATGEVQGASCPAIGRAPGIGPGRRQDPRATGARHGSTSSPWKIGSWLGVAAASSSPAPAAGGR